jgi:hypothetical protein
LTDGDTNMSGLALPAHARLWRCMLVLLLPLCAKAASVWGLNHEGLLPCIFQTLTELPCFLCGGTHAVMHLLSLDISQAMQDNAAVTLIAIVLLAYGVMCLLESIQGHCFFTRTMAQNIRAWALRASGLTLLANWAVMLIPSWA